jgi:hypothetical protein
MNIYSIKNKKKIMEMRYLRTFEGFSSSEKTNEAFLGGSLRQNAELAELLGETRDNPSVLADEKRKKQLKKWYDEYIQVFPAKLVSQSIPSVAAFLNGKIEAEKVVPAEVAMCLMKAKQVGQKKKDNKWDNVGKYGGDAGQEAITGEGGSGTYDPNDYKVLYPSKK